MNALIVYVDVDETLVRNVSKSRVPIPNTIEHVKSLNAQGATLYCWSSGGAKYARESARALGLEDCFAAFLPKPELMLDDQHTSTWRRLLQVHPTSIEPHTTIAEYQQRIMRQPDQAE